MASLFSTTIFNEKNKQTYSWGEVREQEGETRRRKEDTVIFSDLHESKKLPLVNIFNPKMRLFPAC
jgi:hypothetical protein